MSDSPLKSLRFRPHWSPDDTAQVLGLVSLVATVLAEKPSARRWVEAGSYAGESAAIILAHPGVRLLHCVEQWGKAAEATRQRLQHDPRVTVFRSSTADFARQCSPGSYDVAYIDADHAYDGVKADIEAFAPLLSPGGFLAGHDYHDGFPGVVRAVDEFRGDRPLMRFADSSWALRV